MNTHPVQTYIASCSQLLALRGVDSNEVETKRSANLANDGKGQIRVHFMVDGSSLCTEYYEHIANSDRLTTVDLNEQIYRHSYDSVGRVRDSSRFDLKSSHSQVESFSYKYCANGLLCEIDGPRTDLDDRLFIEYDDRGYMKRLRSATGIIFHAEAMSDLPQYRASQFENLRGNEISQDEPNNTRSAVLRSDSSSRYYSDDSDIVAGLDKGNPLSKRQIGIPDAAIEVIAHLGANSRVERFEHFAKIEKDGFGRLESLVLDGQPSELRYNEASQLTFLGRLDGSHLAQEYDGSGRIVHQVSTGHSLPTEVSFEYDSCENGKGRICTASTNAVSTSYQYSSSGQLQRIETIRVHGTESAAFEYDGLGSLHSIHYPNGMTVKYTRGDSIPSATVTLPGTKEFDLNLSDVWNPELSGQSLHRRAEKLKPKATEEESVGKENTRSLISYLHIKTLDDSGLPNVTNLHREKVYLPDGRILYELLYEDLNDAPSFRRDYIWYDGTMIAFTTDSLSRPPGTQNLMIVHYERLGVPSFIRDADGNTVAEIQTREIKERQHTMSYLPMIPPPDQLALAPIVRAHYADHCIGPSVYINRCLAYWSGFRSYAQPSGYQFVPGAPGEGGGAAIPTEECVVMTSDACPGSSGGGGGGGGSGGGGNTIPFYTIDNVPVLREGIAQEDSEGKIAFGFTTLAASETVSCNAVEGFKYKIAGHANLGSLSMQVTTARVLLGCEKTNRGKYFQNVTLNHEKVHAQKILDVINNANKDPVLGKVYDSSDLCESAKTNWEKKFEQALTRERRRQINHCDHIGEYKQELFCKLLSRKITAERKSIKEKYPNPGSAVCD